MLCGVDMRKNFETPLSHFNKKKIAFKGHAKR